MAPCEWRGNVVCGMADQQTGLSGQVAVVTGASRGIGLAVARRLSAAGSLVVLVSRKEAALAGAAGSLVGPAAWYAVSVREEQAAERVMDYAVERFGTVDILVNNAAT